MTNVSGLRQIRKYVRSLRIFDSGDKLLLNLSFCDGIKDCLSSRSSPELEWIVRILQDV